MDGRITGAVLLDILDERTAQDKKWGQQDHVPDIWLSILTEEVGELATEMLHDRFGAKEDGQGTRQAAERMREEAVQVAAVATAFIECLDRNRGTGNTILRSLCSGSTDSPGSERNSYAGSYTGPD